MENQSRGAVIEAVIVAALSAIVTGFIGWAIDHMKDTYYRKRYAEQYEAQEEQAAS